MVVNQLIRISSYLLVPLQDTQREVQNWIISQEHADEKLLCFPLIKTIIKVFSVTDLILIGNFYFLNLSAFYSVFLLLSMPLSVLTLLSMLLKEEKR